MPVDLQICIVLDYHKTMEYMMISLKNNIEDLVNDVKKQYPTKTIQIGFVGYGGYFCVPHAKVYPFTENIKLLQRQLKHLKLELYLPSNCRSIQEAYAHANDMKWFARKRIIFHMGDGPAFGLKYHEPNIGDLYTPGHPYIVLEEEVEKFARKQIDLVLLKLHPAWGKMIDVIEDHYMQYRDTGFYVENLIGKYHILCDEVYEKTKFHILRQFVQSIG